MIKEQKARAGMSTVNFKASPIMKFANLYEAIRNCQSHEKSLPAKIINTAINVAGLPYGIFGVKAMRPLKQDF